MGSIQPLPSEVVRQIAAGEVIDSLAAVVRELVDNALDAQAQRIAIGLWPELGKVRVADDGVGMGQLDLRWAAAPHTTSKIGSQADLWQIRSLGFRGQALHSLCQVAALEICSRPAAEAALGRRVAYSSQGEPLREETVAIAPGTIVTVSQLFADWPGRQQALPTLPQQLRAVQLCVQHIALCHPQVTFQVELNDKPWFALTPSATARQRLPQILKSVAPSDLREIRQPVLPPSELAEAAQDDSPPSPLGSLYLLVGLPDRCHRRRADWIKVAVNGRLVSLPELEQSVIRAFRFALPRDRYPVCFIHLSPRPDTIDWNRHPDKSAIYLAASAAWSQQIGEALAELLRFNPESLSWTGQRQQAQQLLRAAEAAGHYADPRLAAPETEAAAQTKVAGAFAPAAALPSLRAVAQVQNRYILAEHEGGICLIEQHIAHERVLYEQICQQWRIVPLETPLILEHLSQAQVDTLQQLQLEVAPFGPQLWAVRTAPAPLAQRSDLAAALLELSLTPALEAAKVAIACRTALRNGTPLSLDAMQALLQDWQNTRQPHTCPHGRPICLSLAETSLARFFKRHWVIGKSHGLEDPAES